MIAKKLLIDVYKEHSKGEIELELAFYSHYNFGNGPVLSPIICDYLRSIGINEGYLEDKPLKTI